MKKPQRIYMPDTPYCFGYENDGWWRMELCTDLKAPEYSGSIGVTIIAGLWFFPIMKWWIAVPLSLAIGMGALVSVIILKHFIAKNLVKRLGIENSICE